MGVSKLWGLWWYPFCKAAALTKKQAKTGPTHLAAGESFILMASFQSFGSTILPRLSEVFRDLHPPRGLNFRPCLSRSGASFGRCCVLGESEVLLGRKSLGSGLETSDGLCAATSTRRVFVFFSTFCRSCVCVCARVFGATLSFGVLSKWPPTF